MEYRTQNYLSSQIDMYRMIYVSKIKYFALFDPNMFNSISKYADHIFKMYGVSNLMLFGNGYFLHCLEGTEENLTNIKNDLLSENLYLEIKLVRFDKISESILPQKIDKLLLVEKNKFTTKPLLKFLPFKPFEWSFDDFYSFLKLISQCPESKKALLINTKFNYIWRPKLLVLPLKNSLKKQQIVLSIQVLGLVLVIYIFWILRL